MNKVTAHVLPISSSCTAVKMISGETEIAVHDYSVCTLISYTQTSYLKKKKKRWKLQGDPHTRCKLLYAPSGR